MKATFTWDDAGTGQTPPPIVVVTEVVTVVAEGDTFSASSSFSTTSIPTTNGIVLYGDDVTVIQNPGSSFTKQISASAAATLNVNSQSGLAAASVSGAFTVAAYPVSISLQGVRDKYTDPKCLIGQKVEAKLTTSLPLDVGETYTWTASGDRKFNSYVMGQSAATLNTTINVNNVNLQLAYAKPQSSTLACTFSPDLWGLEDMDLNVSITIAPPESPSMTFSQGSMGVWLYGSQPIFGTTGLTVTIPNNSWYQPNFAGQTGQFGVKWTTEMYTPTVFQTGNGDTVFYVNTLTGVDRWYTDANNNRLPMNVPYANFSGSRKLDGGLPYIVASIGYFPALSGLKLEIDQPYMNCSPSDKKMEMNDHHEVFLMYKPPWNGFESYEVPVVSTTWNPHGSATKVSGTWQLDSGSAITVGTAVSYPDFPIYPQ